MGNQINPYTNPNTIISGKDVTLLDIVDDTNLSVDTYYYPAATGLSMVGLKDVSLTGKLACTTDEILLAVEVSNDENTASADWIQIYGYNTHDNNTVNEISVTDGTIYFAWDFDNLNYQNIRIKLVVGNATNTAIIKVRRKAL